MNFGTKRQLAFSALCLNLVSILVLIKWQIGWFHLNRAGVIAASLCLSWCMVALGLVMFQHGGNSADVDVLVVRKIPKHHFYNKYVATPAYALGP